MDISEFAVGDIYQKRYTDGSIGAFRVTGIGETRIFTRFISGGEESVEHSMSVEYLGRQGWTKVEPFFEPGKLYRRPTAVTTSVFRPLEVITVEQAGWSTNGEHKKVAVGYRHTLNTGETGFFFAYQNEFSEWEEVPE